jgi:hypothetical protein
MPENATGTGSTINLLPVNRACIQKKEPPAIWLLERVAPYAYRVVERVEPLSQGFVNDGNRIETLYLYLYKGAYIR